MTAAPVEVCSSVQWDNLSEAFFSVTPKKGEFPLPSEKDTSGSRTGFHVSEWAHNGG